MQIKTLHHKTTGYYDMDKQGLLDILHKNEKCDSFTKKLNQKHTQIFQFPSKTFQDENVDMC